MKKLCLCIVLLAFIAILSFLAACSDDEPENLDGSSEWRQIQDAITVLTNPDGPIAKCNDENPNCPKYNDIPSSSSQSQDGSSPPGNGEVNSSPSHKDDSSSSDNNSDIGKPSSSSATINKPSDENCPVEVESGILTKITSCGWNKTSVEAGDPATFQMTISDPSCTAEEATYKIGNGSTITDYALFTNGIEVTTSGTYPKLKDNNPKLTAEMKEWPREAAAFTVEGRISCGEYLCSKPCSPLKIIKSGDPIVNDIDFSCPWATLAGTTAPSGTLGNLTKGSMSSTPCALTGTITNQDKVQCTDPANGILTAANIRYCGGTTPADCATKEGKIEIEAIAKCKGGTSIIKTLVYNVVPNPSVSGTCAWDTKNNTFGGGVTAKVTSASTATINDSYGRCDAAPSFFVNNAKKTLVSAGLVVDAWDGTITQQMTGITIGVSCGSTNVNTITCPSITVKDPNAMCEYQQNWCEGIALNKIKTADVTSDPGVGQAGENPGACFFATTVDKIGNVSETQFKVNGVSGSVIGKCGNTGWSQPTCATALASVDKADNGYYIYVSNAAWTAQDLRLSNSYKPQLHPNCEAQK